MPPKEVASGSKVKSAQTWANVAAPKSDKVPETSIFAGGQGPAAPACQRDPRQGRGNVASRFPSSTLRESYCCSFGGQHSEGQSESPDADSQGYTITKDLTRSSSRPGHSQVGQGTKAQSRTRREALRGRSRSARQSQGDLRCHVTTRKRKARSHPKSPNHRPWLSLHHLQQRAVCRAPRVFAVMSEKHGHQQGWQVKQQPQQYPAKLQLKDWEAPRGHHHTHVIFQGPKALLAFLLFLISMMHFQEPPASLDNMVVEPNHR